MFSSLETTWREPGRGNSDNDCSKLPPGLVEQLESLNDEFGGRLEPHRDGVSYDEVETAYVELEDAFHRLLITVMHDYCTDMETLNEVLSPVQDQTERTRRHLTTRGSIPEVDPETGEPIENTGDGSGGSNPPTDETTSNDETSTDETTTDETTDNDSSGGGS